MGRIVGIDLGTTNSAVAIYEMNEPKIIVNREGDRLTPSIVYIKSIDEIIVGKRAKNQRVLYPDKIIASVKRHMGTNKIFDINGKKYTPEEISAFILKKIKLDAEEYLGEEIKDAIITVPAYFNDNQRKATIDAGRIAGLNVVRIINEPTASVLSYGLKADSFDGIVLVYDLGGGTFDVSILDVGDGVYNVIATAGDNKLGGDDFDQRLLELILNKFKEETGIDLKEDKFALQKLVEEVENAKILLSSKEVVEINIPFISANEKGPIHLNYQITREMFESLIENLVDYTIKLTEKVIEDANLNIEQIDKVLLTGGSTRIPIIRRKLEILFPDKIERKLNPDESVALGAAIQGAIINREIENVVLVDVTPLSLGIEVEGGLFVPIIERNTPIPCENEKTFTTIADNQKVVEINVYQGERKVCKENVYLGKFILKNIRKAKAGEPQIKVKFSIDVNGTLIVSAYDVDTKAKQEITIDPARGLSEKDIKEMIEKARDNEISDRHFEEKIKTKNKIKNLIRIIKNYRDKLNNIEDIKDELENTIIEIEDNLKGDADIDKLREYYETLKYYRDELNLREEEIIQNQLFGGE